MPEKPTTLGEKLSAAKPTSGAKAFVRNAFLKLLSYVLILALVALPAWWIVTAPQMSIEVMAVLSGILVAMWIYAAWIARKLKSGDATHSLLAHDRNGFMAGLPLDAKTAVFDGSNIYHFGHDNDVDAQPLGLLAQQLRAEGYRIICFFDANIFYRLQEHGAFAESESHCDALLTDIFGLASDEIFIVPSGVQADLYILNTLKHMPTSFAVTNDQFRDYKPQFRDVMKGQWRKGVKISKGEVKLLQHKLESPVRIG